MECVISSRGLLQLNCKRFGLPVCFVRAVFVVCSLTARIFPKCSYRHPAIAALAPLIRHMHLTGFLIVTIDSDSRSARCRPILVR